MALTRYLKEDDFEKIINNRIELLTGGKKLNKKDQDLKRWITKIFDEGNNYWSTLEKKLWRIYLWKDISDFTTSSTLLENYKRVKKLALAYATSGSKLEKNKKLRDDIIFALDWLYKNKYNENTAIKGGLQNYEFEIAEELNDILILLGKDLSKEQTSKFLKIILAPNSPYQFVNREQTDFNIVREAHKIWVNTLSAALVKDSQKIKGVFPTLKNILQIVQKGDGYDEFGNFIFNSVPADGSKGIEVLYQVSRTIFILRGTTKEALVKEFEPQLQQKIKALTPIIFKGKILDEFRGEERFIHGSEEERRFQLMNSSIWLYNTFSAKDNVRQLIAQLSSGINLTDLFTHSDIKTLLFFKEVSSEKIGLHPEVENKTYFYKNLNRVIMKRASFSCAITVANDKIGIAEKEIAENTKDEIILIGSNSLYLDTLKTFNWSTINPLLFPGTTISIPKKETEKLKNKSRNSSYAVALLDDEFASVGIDFKEENTSLVGKQSWFLLDDEVVALGVGIKCKENYEVSTIMENRKIDPLHSVITVNGKVVEKGKFKNLGIQGLEWLFIRPGKDSLGVGYYFPKYYDNINAYLESRKGAFLGTHKNNIDTPKISDEYFTMQQIHGTRPVAGSYQYVLVPGYIEQVKRYDTNPDIVVLQNNNSIQAVKEKNLNLVAANFWSKEETSLSVDGRLIINCNHPVSLLYQENGQEGTLSLSDLSPDNAGIAKIEIINSNIIDMQSKDSKVLVFIKDDDIIKLSIDLKNTKGKSLTYKFKLNYLEEKELKNGN